ncbi:RING-type domain-containing protein [Mycena indigotica]|uniref:RING-type domain-containing protein n=1 Tax=Mycena indigotica TaxID=2126181 RepID=A0A8H6T785_9AGAR|nr:RING-type domain-containing protein [Mycena indigotica]KAF7312195.1 RING-type domain-containing protein [Mycena indigotica]
MVRHAKNATASSVFSYAERQTAAAHYGTTRRKRLGHESMLAFDCCSLCLQTAREPVVCKSGHLFCKECAVNDLLGQKKELKRQKEQAEKIKKQIEADVEAAKAAARDRVLQDFERGQLGIGSSSSSASTSTTDSTTTTGGKRSFSTAFEFSSAHVSDLVAKAEEAAARLIAKEKAEAAKAVLPDFWLPSLTPTFGGIAQRDIQAAGGAQSKELKPGVVCRGGGERHSLALKDLTPVKFTFFREGKEEDKDIKSTGEAVCQPCMKKLSNNVVMFLMKPCSHVVCKTCKEKLMNDGDNCACVVCETPLKKKDMLELHREGTGFAGGGMAETSRAGMAFQA